MKQRPSIYLPEDKINEAQHQETCLWTHMPSEDSDQPVHLQSDQNLHWAHFGQPRMQSFFMQTTKAQM